MSNQESETPMQTYEDLKELPKIQAKKPRKKKEYETVSVSKAVYGDLIEHDTGIKVNGEPYERFLVAAHYKELAKKAIFQTAMSDYKFFANTKLEEKGEGTDRVVFIYVQKYTRRTKAQLQEQVKERDSKAIEEKEAEAIKARLSINVSSPRKRKRKRIPTT